MQLSEAPGPEITALLRQWSGGDESAMPLLMELVYGELRKIARGHFRSERAEHTLQPTALVNEAFLKLVDQGQVDWRDRRHFYAMASHMMRRLLVDHARRRRAAKRQAPSIDLGRMRPDGRGDLLELDEALTRLARAYPREGRVVELRYFAGMTLEEVALELGVSLPTVKRDWAFAKGWLLRELSSPHARDSGT